MNKKYYFLLFTIIIFGLKVYSVSFPDEDLDYLDYNLIYSTEEIENLVFQKIDLNTANLDELLEIPYMRLYAAKKILYERRKRGFFVSKEELKEFLGDFLYEKIEPFIEVRYIPKIKKYSYLIKIKSEETGNTRNNTLQMKGENPGNIKWNFIIKNSSNFTKLDLFNLEYTSFVKRKQILPKDKGKFLNVKVVKSKKQANIDELMNDIGKELETKPIASSIKVEKTNWYYYDFDNSKDMELLEKYEEFLKKKGKKNKKDFLQKIKQALPKAKEKFEDAVVKIYPQKESKKENRKNKPLYLVKKMKFSIGNVSGDFGSVPIIRYRQKQLRGVKLDFYQGNFHSDVLYSTIDNSDDNLFLVNFDYSTKNGMFSSKILKQIKDDGSMTQLGMNYFYSYRNSSLFLELNQLIDGGRRFYSEISSYMTNLKLSFGFEQSVKDNGAFSYKVSDSNYSFLSMLIRMENNIEFYNKFSRYYSDDASYSFLSEFRIKPTRRLETRFGGVYYDRSYIRYKIWNKTTLKFRNSRLETYILYDEGNKDIKDDEIQTLSLGYTKYFKNFSMKFLIENSYYYKDGSNDTNINLYYSYSF